MFAKDSRGRGAWQRAGGRPVQDTHAAPSRSRCVESAPAGSEATRREGAPDAERPCRALPFERTVQPPRVR